MQNERKKFKFEVLLDRYFSNFHRVLLTNLLFAVPSAAVFALMYFLNMALFHREISVAFSFITVILLYPFYAGVVMVVRNIARGDSDVKVISSFFGAIKENFFKFFLHGILLCAATELSYFAIYLYSSMLDKFWIFYAFLFFTILIVLFLFFAAFYIPLMTVTFDIKLRYIYKNSLLMSYGEFKNNFFALLAMAIISAICLTIIFLAGNTVALLIIAAVLWALIFPASVTFAYIFFIYDGMHSMISSKADSSEKDTAMVSGPAVFEPEDFSNIDISMLKDSDDYIFHNGRMMKQSALLRMIKEQNSEVDHNE